MKAKAIHTLFVLTVIGLLSAPVLAGPTGPAYKVTMSGSGYGQGGVNGGAFLATPKTGGANWDNLNIDGPFRTFCAEPTVLGFGDWATIDDTIYFGGSANGVAVPAEVRSVLAYWFEGGYTAIGLNDDQLGNMTLQAYIWKTIYGSTPSAWNSFVTNSTNAAAISNLGTTYGGGHALAGSVKVMNLWTSSTLFDGSTDRQSQFIIVPLPGAVLLGLIGFGAAARMRRSA